MRPTRRALALLLAAVALPLGAPAGAQENGTCQEASDLSAAFQEVVEAYHRSEVERVVEETGAEPALVERYLRLFAAQGIPLDPPPPGQESRRIVMVSTHGYHGDPPPAGVPDTGGQTHYVLTVSKAWASEGRQVIILARRFGEAPPVERFGPNVWLVRLSAGGESFVRKEDLYPLTPELAEAATVVSGLFRAQAVVGHYADGMTVAAEVGLRLGIPYVAISHSLGLAKLQNLGLAPHDPAALLHPDYNFWLRLQAEREALRSARLVIANTPEEPPLLRTGYGLDPPLEVMPAGAAEAFFQAALEPLDAVRLTSLGLTPGRYLVFWGRLSEAKNAAGVVAALGEARALAAARGDDSLEDLKVVIFGGAPEGARPTGEEERVEAAIRGTRERYRLPEGDVVRIPASPHPEIAAIARGALAFVATQRVEPFGMAAAEAMALGLPLLISRSAGITAWLEHGIHGLIIDPEDPRATGEELLALAGDEERRSHMGQACHHRALDQFGWGGIAHHQGELLDQLRAESTGPPAGFHRLTPSWRGRLPAVGEEHLRVAEVLLPDLLQGIRDFARSGQRMVVAVADGSEEVLQLLAMMLPREGLHAVVIPEEDFPPGTDAVGQARNAEVLQIHVPAYSRALGRHYHAVPLDLRNAEVVFITGPEERVLEEADLVVLTRPIPKELPPWP